MKAMLPIKRNQQPLRASSLAAAVLTLFLTAKAGGESLSPVYTGIWSLNQGSRYDLPASASNTERGIAWNPATGNVLLTSRTGGSNHVSVINGATGADLGALSNLDPNGTNVIAFGTLALQHVRADEDGVIYACNLSGGSASTLKIYRWNSEQDGLTNGPVVAFSLTGLFPRYGDTMDLRGKGTDTQILIAGAQSVATSTNFAILTTADGTNFVIKEYPYIFSTNLVGACAKGISFDGTNNALYGKRDGNGALFHIGFDDPYSGGTSNWLIETIPTDANFVGTEFLETNGVKIVSGTTVGAAATTNATTHRARAYQLTGPGTSSLVLDVAMPEPYFANGNVIGASDALPDGRTVIFEPNNGIRAFTIGLVSNLPPSIASPPQGNTNILTGGYYSISVSANGTAPLRYQWRLEGAPVNGATNATLALTNLAAGNAGNYTVVITNVAGAITSSPALIGLQPAVLSTVSAKLWQLPPGSRSYLTVDNTQRGLAYNPASNHVLLVNRSGTPSVNILDASTGANVTNLDLTGVGGQLGETFPISMVGVADDGAVYVCNLGNTGSGGGFTIYRWADDAPTTTATIAYGPDSPAGSRIGDAFVVSGSGVNTRLIASTRNATQVVVFTTGDGVYFSPNVVDVTTATAGFAGLGLAAGAGDTFWATSSGGFPLVKVFYDLINGTNEIQLSLTGQTGFNISADPQNGFVADIGTTDTPSTLRLLDVFNQTSAAVLMDQEFFGTDNENANGTGAVAFDVNGGRIFALDSNNGLIALKYAPRLFHTTVGAESVLSWTGPGKLQASTNVLGTYVDVSGATSPYTNSPSGSLYFRVQR